MRFDYYAATIDAPPKRIIDAFATLGSHVENADTLAKRYFYQQGFTVKNERFGTTATICAGGENGRTLAFASGNNTDEFVKLIRSEFTDSHFVTRADAAQDFIDAKGYDSIRKIALKVAKENRLAFSQRIDELNPNAGRTQYVGSEKSNFRVRLYEKGFEQLSHMKHHPADMLFTTPEGLSVKPDEWIRLELQARPQGDIAKFLASHAAPAEIWGYSPWAHQLAQKTMQLDIERVTMRLHKQLEPEKAFQWMIKQYAKTMLWQYEQLGSWAAVGSTIGDSIEQQAKAKRRMGA
jgi:hypothetical protein